jgi:hypothetical protein
MAFLQTIQYQYNTRPLVLQYNTTPILKKIKIENNTNSADADGGPRSLVRTAGHSAQPPIDVNGNFSAYVSA